MVEKADAHAGPHRLLGVCCRNNSCADPAGDGADRRRHRAGQAALPGEGAGDPLSPGKAANLRETKLDHDQLVEIIRCGVPGGTAMPHFDRFAWTEGEDCFGMTGAEVGDKKPPAPTAELSKREIDAIVAYL